MTKPNIEDVRRLEGTCTLLWGDNDSERVRCRFDLVRNWFTCDRHAGSAQRMNAFSSEIPRILDLEIVTPAGVLQAAELYPSFVVSRGGGMLSTADTPCSMLSGVFGRPSKISFIFNRAVELTADTDAQEVMFLPGFETGQPIALSESLSMVGSKTTVSILGKGSEANLSLERSVSIALGAEARRCISWHGKYVKIWLNSFDFSRKVRPFVSLGGEYKDIQVTRRNIQKIFTSAEKYFGHLEKTERAKADNAIRSLLDARSSATNYFSGILCIFHFLEWFDRSRTLSANSLVERLKIYRPEATAIIDLRNAVVHGNVEPNSALKDCYAALSVIEGKRFGMSADHTRAAAVLDYLHTVIGEALMGELGYDGETQRFL